MAWLEEKVRRVAFDDSMTKSELHHLVHANRPPRRVGHDARRSSPIRYIWNLIRTRVAEGSIDQLENEFESVVQHAISRESAGTGGGRSAARALRRRCWRDARSQFAMNLQPDASSVSQDDSEDELPEDSAQVLISSSDDDS